MNKIFITSLISITITLLPLVAWSYMFTYDEAEGDNLLKTMIVLSTEDNFEKVINEIDSLKQKIEVLSKPVQGDRKNARKLNDQGLNALKAEQDELAKKYWILAHLADPADVEITNNLGLIHLRLGDDIETIKVLKQVLLLSPARSIAWVNLAEYYAIHDRPREAIACYKLAFHFSQNPEKLREGVLKYATPVPVGSEKIKQAALETIRMVKIPIQSADNISNHALSFMEKKKLLKLTGLDEYKEHYISFGLKPPTEEEYINKAQTKQFDLNDDFVNEVFFLPMPSSYTCGNKNCTTTLFKKENEKYIEIGSFFFADDKIETDSIVIDVKNKTNGYKNIISTVDGEATDGGYNKYIHTYRYNGESYIDSGCYVLNSKTRKTNSCDDDSIDYLNVFVKTVAASYGCRKAGEIFFRDKKVFQIAFNEVCENLLSK